LKEIIDGSYFWLSQKTIEQEDENDNEVEALIATVHETQFDQLALSPQ